MIFYFVKQRQELVGVRFIRCKFGKLSSDCDLIAGNKHKFAAVLVEYACSAALPPAIERPQCFEFEVILFGN